MSFFKKIFQFLNKKYSVRANVEIGKDVHIGIGSILWASHNLKIGNDTYIGKFVTIEVNGVIGNEVLIANNVGIIGRNDHDYKVIGKSIRKAPWIGDKDFKYNERKTSIIIEDDCWIGYGAIILSGVKIGRGSIIASGAVVTRDVEPYSIVAGNPARKIANRFDEDEIIKHEEILYK